MTAVDIWNWIRPSIIREYGREQMERINYTSLMAKQLTES